MEAGCRGREFVFAIPAEVASIHLYTVFIIWSLKRTQKHVECQRSKMLSPPSHSILLPRRGSVEASCRQARRKKAEMRSPVGSEDRSNEAGQESRRGGPRREHHSPCCVCIPVLASPSCCNPIFLTYARICFPFARIRNHPSASRKNTGE